MHEALKRVRQLDMKTLFSNWRLRICRKTSSPQKDLPDCTKLVASGLADLKCVARVLGFSRQAYYQ